MTPLSRRSSAAARVLASATLLALAACQTPVKIELSEKISEKVADKREAPAAAKSEPVAAAKSEPAVADKRDAPSLVAPLVEKRETLTATGYAVISVQNHRNAAQQRLMAIRASKLDAYRSLTEQVYGQQLDATTTVADMMVQNDTFRTRVEGVIYGAVLVSITPAGDDTYETTLSLDKAVVHDLRTLYLGQVQAKGR
jgi:hypothetical protein